VTPDPRRRRPPEQTLRWATAQFGRGSRLAALRRLTLGGWHANHALTVVDGDERVHRLVLRRWARPEWRTEDPDMTAHREARTLELLSTASGVPAPRVVAADPDAEHCDVPSLLLTRLPGRPPGLPSDMDAFVAQLAGTAAAIHALAGGGIPPFRRYYAIEQLAPPRWARRPETFERAVEIAAAEPPPGRSGFIHRDYHPENTLWSRGRLTGVVDWTSASHGPLAVDLGHMRWNLAVSYGLDVADAFLERADAGPDQPYWDLATALDVLPEMEPGDWSRLDLDRFERYVAACAQ
jgi:aminoglycoside phosphotransferase (APT) family kinase protein